MRSTRAELTTDATPCREDPGVTVEAAAGGHPHLSLGVSRCSGSAGSRWAFRPLSPGCCWGERMAGDRRARRPGVLYDGLASRALSWRPGGQAGFGRATTGGPTRCRRGVTRRLTSFLLGAVECSGWERRASRFPAHAAETATPPLVPPDSGGTNDRSAERGGSRRDWRPGRGPRGGGSGAGGAARRRPRRRPSKGPTTSQHPPPRWHARDQAVT